MPTLVNLNIHAPDKVIKEYSNTESVIYMGANVRKDVGKPKAFIDLGYNVLFVDQKLAYNHPLSKLFEQRFFAACVKINPKYIFIINGKAFTKGFLKRLSKTIKGKTILWYGDQRGKPYKEDIMRAGEVDVFAMSNVGTKPYFEKYGIKPYFMPCEAMTEIFVPSNIPYQQRKDIVFVGNGYDENEISNRRDMVVNMTRLKVCKEMKKRYKSRFDIYGLKWSRIYGIKDAKPHVDLYRMPLIYNKYKIILGHNSFGYVDRYVSNRFWNALSTGTLHITNKTNGLEKLIENKKHAVWYKSIKQLFNLVDYYLSHPSEAQLIGKQGREFILENHTALHRISDLLKYTNSVKK